MQVHTLSSSSWSVDVAHIRYAASLVATAWKLFPLFYAEYALRCADSTNRCNCTHRSHYYDVNHTVIVTTITTTTTLATREGGRGRRTSPEGGYRLGGRHNNGT